MHLLPRGRARATPRLRAVGVAATILLAASAALDAAAADSKMSTGHPRVWRRWAEGVADAISLAASAALDAAASDSC